MDQEMEHYDWIMEEDEVRFFWLIDAGKLLLVLVLIFIISLVISRHTFQRMSENKAAEDAFGLGSRLTKVEKTVEELNLDTAAGALAGIKIIYDGDSIAESRSNNGGGYAGIIAAATGGTYENYAKGGAHLCAAEGMHSVVNNLPNLPKDGDLYCFEGGINDFWSNTPIGKCTPGDYTGDVDPATICGAMETIFRYSLENFKGKPVCFVITHKVQNTATEKNKNGNTFQDYRNAMVKVCEKYSIPYYDAFTESGLNGWNKTQNKAYLNSNATNEPDGIHPNEDGYRRYYVPQLIDLFKRILPVTD